MTKLAISSILLGFGGIVMALMPANSQGAADSSIRKIYKDKADEEYRNRYSNELKDLDNLKARYDELKDREDLEINNRIGAWENASGYASAMEALDDELTLRIRDIKMKTYDYDNEVNRIRQKRDDSIVDWKMKEEWQVKMDSFEERKKEAKTAYDRQYGALTFSNVHGCNDELIKKAKEDKSMKLNQINTEKQKLENDLKAFKNNAEVQCNREIRDLTSRMNTAIDEASKDVSEKKKDFVNARSKELASIFTDVKDEETEEEKSFAYKINAMESRLIDNRIDIECKMMNEAQKLGEDDRYVLYLKSRGVSKSQFLRNRLVPVGLFGCGIIAYVMHVLDIADKMED